jgi:hypothetical protein
MAIAAGGKNLKQRRFFIEISSFSLMSYRSFTDLPRTQIALNRGDASERSNYSDLGAKQRGVTRDA